MKELMKPGRLKKGDLIATVSPCNGWAGDPEVKWKYDLGVSRLQKLGLRTIAAPNSMRGSGYLSKNPEARAEDITWAFENREVRAIIANIGGNDSIRLIPYIDPKVICEHPKIFIGYSDVMNLHLLCYHSGLSTFYGDNLLTTIADQAGWHEYGRKWFEKTLFDPTPIGVVEASEDWTFELSDHHDPMKKRRFYPNSGYRVIQGSGVAYGRLIGGHTGIMELEGSPIELRNEDYEDGILFVEDIPEFFDEEGVQRFFSYLGEKGILQKLKGILVGKLSESESFSKRAEIIRRIVSGQYSCGIPIMYGLNFGHSAPVCPLPYGATAEINCEHGTFAIRESGVI